MLPLVTGIILLVFLLVFLFYAAVSIRHATRFRFISKRVVYLTLLFVAVGTVLLTAALIAYLMILFN